MSGEKSRLNLKVNIYIIMVFIAAVIFTVISIQEAELHRSLIIGFVVFATLIILSNLSPVKLPRVGSVTITYAIHMAAIFIFGPLIPIISEIISSTILYLRRPKGEKIKEVFNGSQFIICIFLASLLIEPWFGREISFNSFLLANVFLMSFVYFLVNTLLVTMVISLHQNMNPLGVWVTNFKLLTPHYLILAPLGLGIAIIYYHIGVLGVVLFFLPLLLARYSFKLYMDVRENYLNTMGTLIKTVEAKDTYTKGHSERVAYYSTEIGKKIGLGDVVLEQLYYLALLHDVGKVALSDTILNKNGKLSDDEFDDVKQHSRIGAEIVKDIKLLKDEDNVILHHHERWGGGGYPTGKKGEEIPLLSRIIAVADSFDAMTSDRAYRDALTVENAVREIIRCSGSQFDPKVVDAFIECLPDIMPEVNLSELKKMPAAKKTKLAY